MHNMENEMVQFDNLFSLKAHKNSQNMTEIEAKVSYVKLARSLKTYGVSFFLVKVNPGH